MYFNSSILDDGLQIIEKVKLDKVRHSQNQLFLQWGMIMTRWYDLLTTFIFQDIHISKEHRTVQPRSTSISSRGSISTMSRGSLKSDPFAGNEDTSSISARSDTSVDSYVFDHSFGEYDNKHHYMWVLMIDQSKKSSLLPLFSRISWYVYKIHLAMHLVVPFWF